jgi:hypothetical protein
LTLLELKARGIRQVRRMEWVYPHQYVDLDLREDGTYGPTGVLHTLADEVAVGASTHIEVVVASLGEEDDRWEPYPKP